MQLTSISFQSLLPDSSGRRASELPVDLRPASWCDAGPRFRRDWRDLRFVAISRSFPGKGASCSTEMFVRELLPCDMLNCRRLAAWPVIGVPRAAILSEP